MTTIDSVRRAAVSRPLIGPSRVGLRRLASAARQREKSEVEVSITIDTRSRGRAMDPATSEVGYMSKGLTGIGAGTAASIAPRVQSLTLVGRQEPAAPPRADLLAAIHDRVIPELLLAHRAARSAAPRAPESMVFPSAQAVAELARIAVCEDLERAIAFVDAAAAKGLSRVLLDLVFAAAVLVEAQVNADVRTPLEGALGKSLLQLLVHVLGTRCTRVQACRGLVLLAAPCEHVALDIYVLEEFLRSAGWTVQVEPSMREPDLVGILESVRVESVGLSVSRDDELEPLRRLIAAMRRASRNRDLVILLAGSLADTESAATVGADCCIADPRDAVRWLDGHAKAPASQLM